MDAEGVFISYRRSDLPYAAGRLNDALSLEFGAHRIFRDIDDIEAGVDFTERLNEALASCKVLLVLIGNAWMGTADRATRRLDDPADWVRQEIATALRRRVRVIPVLLEQARMPAENELPEELKPMARRQAITLSDAHWQSDVNRLIATLHQIDAASAASTPASPVQMAAEQAAELGKRVGIEARKWMRRLMMLGLGLLALMALVTVWLVRSCNREPPEVAGLWRGDDGSPFEFERADHDGERAYTVEAVLPDMTRLECNATPSYFGSLTMECQSLKAGVTDDRWRCETLTILGSPPEITGNCRALRDGGAIALKLRRAGK